MPVSGTGAPTTDGKRTSDAAAGEVATGDTADTMAVLRAFAKGPRPRSGGEPTAIRRLSIPATRRVGPPKVRRGGIRRLQPTERARLATIFTWVQNLGAIVLLFVAWQLWGTAIGEHHAQDALQQQFDAKLHSGTRPAGVITPAHGSLSGAPNGSVQLISAAAQFQDPAEGSVVARLAIPKIALSQFVVSGTAADDLAKGPGHYVGTALPGQAGNVAIAGHRTTHGAPFNRLAELAVGDPIYLTTTWGERLTYIVSQTPYPVSPSNTSVLSYAGDNRLTLTTCNPEFSAAQRLIVVAKLQQPVAATAGAAQPPTHPYLIASQGPAGWNWGELPLAALVALGMVALGLLNRRLALHFDPVGRWLVLVPIWAAGLYLLFQILENFLPAAV
jgi:sortase A